MPQRVESPFYQDLHMLRLMPVMQESGLLECMVKEYLEPVILYDKQNSGRLYQTLNIFYRQTVLKGNCKPALYCQADPLS